MPLSFPSPINPVDVEEVRRQVAAAIPFPHFRIDNFLEEDFANRVYDDFPAFEEALRMGGTFHTVNERGKVQITDFSRFGPVVAELNNVLSSQPFLDSLSHVMNIPNLLADEELVGGGIHETRSQGRLDVHVDFNYIQERELHRRLNILIFFNKEWKDEYGGFLELWDQEVTVCHHSFMPVFNRCVVFETSDISYHGVTAIKCPPGLARKSFAAYYYTKEAPAHWTGKKHSTIFKARPDEVVKGRVLMPVERTLNRFATLAKKGIKKVIGKS